MVIEYSAEQIRTALVDAVRDDEPQEVCDSLARLLAIHYPAEFERLQLALAISQLLEETDHAHP